MAERGPYLSRRQALLLTGGGIAGLAVTVGLLEGDNNDLQARHPDPVPAEQAASARATVTVFESQAVAAALAKAPQDIQQTFAIDTSVRTNAQQKDADRIDGKVSLRELRNAMLISGSFGAILVGAANYLAQRNAPKPKGEPTTS